MQTINLAADYSPYPAGRYTKDGRFSGEGFRDRVLMPLLEKAEKIVVNIDNVATLPSSFWEEVWGGMIRERRIDKQSAHKRFEIVTTDKELQTYVANAWEFLDNAKPK